MTITIILLFLMLLLIEIVILIAYSRLNKGIKLLEEYLKAIDEAVYYNITTYSKQIFDLTTDTKILANIIKNSCAKIETILEGNNQE